MHVARTFFRRQAEPAEPGRPLAAGVHWQLGTDGHLEEMSYPGAETIPVWGLTWDNSRMGDGDGLEEALATPPERRPPAADTVPAGQWTELGYIGTTNGEFLIIPNHPVPAAHGDFPMDRVHAYNVLSPASSTDQHVETFTADMYAPDWDTPMTPGRRLDEAVIIRTHESSLYTVEGRTCDDPEHPGWCELRIKLHDHGPANPELDAMLDEVGMMALTMTDDQKRELRRQLSHPPQPDPAPGEA